MKYMRELYSQFSMNLKFFELKNLFFKRGNISRKIGGIPIASADYEVVLHQCEGFDNCALVLQEVIGREAGWQVYWYYLK